MTSGPKSLTGIVTFSNSFQKKCELSRWWVESSTKIQKTSLKFHYNYFAHLHNAKIVGGERHLLLRVSTGTHFAALSNRFLSCLIMTTNKESFSTHKILELGWFLNFTVPVLISRYIFRYSFHWFSDFDRIWFWFQSVLLTTLLSDPVLWVWQFYFFSPNLLKNTQTSWLWKRSHKIPG